MTALKAFVAAAVLASVAVTAAPVIAQTTPSFNCKRARTFVEKAICQNPSLATKDRRMSKLYFQQLRSYQEYGDMMETRAFQAEQRSWLARRDRCQTNGCLHTSYDIRIRQLEQAFH